MQKSITDRFFRFRDLDIPQIPNKKGTLARGLPGAFRGPGAFGSDAEGSPDRNLNFSPIIPKSPDPNPPVADLDKWGNP